MTAPNWASVHRVEPISTAHANWLLQHPLEDAAGPDPAATYRSYVPQPDGAVLTAVLAVDR